MDSSTLNFITVVIGWVLVHFFSLRRDVRKDRIATINEIIQEILAVEDEAIDFHSAAQFDPVKQKKITIRISRLMDRINAPPLRDYSLGQGYKIAFRSAITLNNFDKSAFETKSVDSELIDEINTASSELVHAIRLRCQIYVEDNIF